MHSFPYLDEKPRPHWSQYGVVITGRTFERMTGLMLRGYIVGTDCGGGGESGEGGQKEFHENALPSL